MTNYQKAVIVWFDDNIGRFDWYPLLKKAFAKMVAHECDSTLFLDDDTAQTYAMNHFSRSSYHYETIAIDLYAFNNTEECMQCIERQQHNQIFLIVSPTSGKRVVPQIIRKYPNVLPKSYERDFRSAYILRSNSSTGEELWPTMYTQYSQSFLGETELMKKFINDVAHYFMDLGESQYECGTATSLYHSLEYYKRAKIVLTTVFGDSAEWIYKQTLSNLQQKIALSQAMLRDTFSVSIDQLTDKMTTAEIYEGNSINNIVPPSFTVMTNDPSNSGLEEQLESSALSHDRKGIMFQAQQHTNDKRCRPTIKAYLRIPLTPTENFTNLQSLLRALLSPDSVISLEASEYSKLFKVDDSSIVVQTLSSDDDEQALGEIFSLGKSVLLYILGTEPRSIDERKDFFTKYPQVCAILNDPKELATKILLDFALKSRVMGHRYASNRDAECANIMYAQCMGLLSRLNTFMRQEQQQQQWMT